MTENSTATSAAATPSPNRGVKQGLPATGLPAAEDAANKLWSVARLATANPEAFAKQWGSSRRPSGSGWDTRMAMMRGFGLIRVDENKQIGLSPLGQQLVNSSEPTVQVQARRAALLKLKAYRELVDAFEGYEVPALEALATKLQFEYGKKEDFARRAAQAFMDSLRHAEMLDGANVVRKGGVTTPVTATSAGAPSDEEGTSAGGDDEARAAEIDAAFEEEADEDEDLAAREAERVLLAQSKQQPGTGSSVSLTVTLDLSKFRADEVIQILSALGLGSRD